METTPTINALLARDDYKHPRLVRDALGYAASGLRVIPLHDRDKRSRIERWQVRGTTEPDRIIGWFQRWPESNVGILTGGGIIALDVDPRNGGKRSLGELLGRRGLPETAHARTGNHGDHYLFRVDPTLKVGNVSMVSGRASTSRGNAAASSSSRASTPRPAGSTCGCVARNRASPRPRPGWSRCWLAGTPGAGLPVPSN